jgi:molybdenum cofactor guanylyltransferase
LTESGAAPIHPNPVGVILAGGLSRRMGGGDKGLLPFGSGTLLGAVIARFAPQVDALALNANGDAARFGRFGLPVLSDGVAGFRGPLAGVLAAMDWAAALGAGAVVTVAADTPFLPCDLVPRLIWAAEGGSGLAIAATSGVGVHPTAALWPVSLRDDLAAALARGEGKVTDFTSRHNAAVTTFPPGPPDPFLNVNTPADLAAAKAWL